MDQCDSGHRSAQRLFDQVDSSHAGITGSTQHHAVGALCGERGYSDVPLGGQGLEVRYLGSVGICEDFPVGFDGVGADAAKVVCDEFLKRTQVALPRPEDLVQAYDSWRPLEVLVKTKFGEFNEPVLVFRILLAPLCHIHAAIHNLVINVAVASPHCGLLDLGFLVWSELKIVDWRVMNAQVLADPLSGDDDGAGPIVDAEPEMLFVIHSGGLDRVAGRIDVGDRGESYRCRCLCGLAATRIVRLSDRS